MVFNKTRKFARIIFNFLPKIPSTRIKTIVNELDQVEVLLYTYKKIKKGSELVYCYNGYRNDYFFNLSDDELILARTKNSDKNKLGFGVLLKYVQLEY